MVNYKKTVFGIFIAIFILFGINVGINAWIKSQLPSIINKENDSSYIITYKNLEVSLFTRTIFAENIAIVPKESSKDLLVNKGICAKVKSIEVKGVSLWNLIFSNKLKANAIKITKPKIIIYEKDKERSVESSVVAPFEKIIKVKTIVLKNGDLKLMSKEEDTPILSIQNINFKVDGILISDAVLKKKIPLEYKNYALTCDSLFYHPNSFYNLKTKKVAITNANIEVANFEMIPMFPRKEFVSKLKYEEDIFTLLCKSISFRNSDWGFNKDDFFFHTKSIILEEMTANIYRSKIPADDLTKKYLYNKLLRDLKLDLKVDSLKIRNSKLVYEEEKSFQLGAGILSFDKFNLTATNVASGFKKTKLPDVKIAIDCKFMNKSPFHVNWNFNVLDKSDGFTIRGKLNNFETEQMNAFTKPYLNITSKGVLDEVRFKFSGNDLKSSGNFALKYDNLDVVIYQKDTRKKKNKVLSFIANLFVKKDSDEKVKDVNVEVERIQEKSFYNFLWMNVAEGLKKILI